MFRLNILGWKFEDIAQKKFTDGFIIKELFQKVTILKSRFGLFSSQTKYQDRMILRLVSIQNRSVQTMFEIFRVPISNSKFHEELQASICLHYRKMRYSKKFEKRSTGARV